MIYLTKKADELMAKSWDELDQDVARSILVMAGQGAFVEPLAGWHQFSRQEKDWIISAWRMLISAGREAHRAAALHFDEYLNPEAANDG